MDLRPSPLFGSTDTLPIVQRQEEFYLKLERQKQVA
jgi:hypothetical protein